MTMAQIGREVAACVAALHDILISVMLRVLVDTGALSVLSRAVDVGFFAVAVHLEAVPV